MATYNGFDVGGVAYSPVTTEPDFSGKDETPSNAGLMAGGVLAGSLSSTQPVSENPVMHDGAKVETYGFLHFYNRIHFQYPELNLGNVLGNQSVGFWVFNAFFTSNTLEDIIRLGVDDLNLEPGDDDTPIVFAPFEQIDFQISISSSGPPTVDVTYTFDFGFEVFDFHVFGNRLVLFPFMPQGNVQETLEFSTAVFSSDNEFEQRAKLRNPRQRFTYNVLLNNNLSTYMQSLLFDWQHRIFGVPIWFEARLNTAVVVAGSQEITVPVDSADFRVGGLVFIYKSADEFEAQAITGIDVVTNTIEVQAPISRNYELALVMPIRDCYAASNIARGRHPVNATEATASFLSLTNIDLSSTAGSAFYDNKVYVSDLNITQGLKSYNIERPIIMVDTKTGTVFQSSNVDQSKLRTQKTWHVGNRAELWRVRRLMHHLTGQRSFFLPTNAHDFQLLQDIGASGTTLRVLNTYYTTFVRNRRPFGDIRLKLKNGLDIVRRIIDSNVDAGDEVLSVNIAFSSSIITVDEVASVELVLLVRIADDKVDFTHKFAGNAMIRANLVTAKQ